MTGTTSPGTNSPGAPPSSGKVDVLFYVQHLLGIGHLRRAAIITRALDRAGLAVVLVSGGMPMPELDLGRARLVQLPPVRAKDESFSVLLDEQGQPIDEAWKTARAGALHALYQETQPRILLTEMFPFGRRSMRFELLPLLDAAQRTDPRPRIICSLRDVLSGPNKPEKTRWMIETFERYFDLLLLHGDPALLPLGHSFPAAAEIAGKTCYTGYVVEDMPHEEQGGSSLGAGEVIVSTGGGAVAAPLIEAVLAAKPLSSLADTIWRVLVGHNLPEAQFEAFRARAPEGMMIERARPDFRRLLARARLSISQAGYNTVMEVLAARIPAVVIPFSGGNETEQSLRAHALAAHGALILVEEAALSAQTLASAVDKALQQKTGDAHPRGPEIDGAEKTARILSELIAIVPP